MLNMDFHRKVIIERNRRGWEPRPMPGVWRQPLARAELENGLGSAYECVRLGSVPVHAGDEICQPFLSGGLKTLEKRPADTIVVRGKTGNYR